MTYDPDEIAIERALNGEKHIPLNVAELTECWRRLEGQHQPAWFIAERLNVSVRTVRRWRASGVVPIGRAVHVFLQARSA